MKIKFNKKELQRQDFSDDTAFVNDLLHIVRKNEYTSHVKSLFEKSLSKTNIGVKGSKKLLHYFDPINRIEDKHDIITKLDKITLLEIVEDEKIVLKFDLSDNDMFEEDELVATSVHNFKNDFFKQLFNMQGYANFCLDNGLDDVLLKNTNELIEIFQDDDKKEKRYRLIKDNDTYYVRALTSSTKYHDYDNALALFIGLLAIDKYADETNNIYGVQYAKFDESNLFVGFSKEKALNVKGVGEVKLVAELSNDEIKREKLQFKVKYLIKTSDGNKIALRPKGDVIEDKVMAITHAANLGSLNNALEEMNKLALHEEQMKLFIDDFSQIEVTEELIYSIFRKLTNSQSELKKGSKDAIMEIRQTIDNTYTLLSILGKIQSINAPLDEKMHIEYISYQVLNEVIEKESKKTSTSKVNIG